MLSSVQEKQSPMALSDDKYPSSTTPSHTEPDQALLQVPGSMPEFDPCQNAHPLSPFYDHDSPRVSSDQRSRSYFYNRENPSVSSDPKSNGPVPVVQVHDLEAQSQLTPSVSLEKYPSRDDGARKWPSRGSGLLLQKTLSHGAMTKPKPKRFLCLAGLTRKQRLIVKLLIAMVALGAVIGIAVGITIRVHGGVWKSSNSSTQIGGS